MRVTCLFIDTREVAFRRKSQPLTDIDTRFRLTRQIAF
jgi:hypothetical protein